MFLNQYEIKLKLYDFREYFTINIIPILIKIENNESGTHII